MEKLPVELKKNGFTYKLIDREPHKALYAQYDGGRVLAYEVFRVSVQNASVSKIQGRDITRKHKELFPNDNAFGKTAWSYMKLENAEKCYEGLEVLKEKNVK